MQAMYLPATDPTRPYRAVVTGAAGFIGSHLVEALLERGHEVVGIDAFMPSYAPGQKRANIASASAHARFDLLPADLNDLDLREVLRRGDVIFHLAGQAGVRSSWGKDFEEYTRANVDATQRLLEAARERDAARVVFASSSSVYGDAPLPMREDGPLHPISPYGVTKLTAEQLTLVYWKAFGLAVVPLRFFSVYGPRQRPDMAFHGFIAAVAQGKPVTVFGDGSQRRDFTYVGDVVAALVAAAERAQPGIPINVGGGSTVTVAETLRIVERLVGRDAIIERRPAPPGDARDTLANTERLHQLGIVPKVCIEEGLARQVEWQLPLLQPAWWNRAPAGASRPSPHSSAPRILLYSHDTYGLGHLRRNTTIAHAIRQQALKAQVTLLTGSPVATQWPFPEGLSVVQLPSVVKVGTDEYRPVQARSMSAVRAERAGIIASTLLRLRPDVFLVDHAPLGMKGELGLALQMAREELPATRVVLGLRDIVDAPDVVRKTWVDQGIYEAIEAGYHEVLVYGSRELFDVVQQYGIPESVARRLRFTGYLAKDRGLEPAVSGRDSWTHARRAGDRRVLVMGGGGGDAGPMLLAAIEAWNSLRHLLFGEAVMVLGPLMAPADRAAVERRANQVAGVQVIHSSTSVLSLVAAADLVVCMGGYNSVVEVVAARKPLVICPRTTPRVEQLLRAEIMARLGLAQVARLDGDGDASARIADAMVAALKAGPPPAQRWRAVDLQGARRVADLVLGAGQAEPAQVAA
jgi:nucleoside-diphosphate-sugar epimerase/predicted glycosyltransferase